jgi:hypothetical protein
VILLCYFDTFGIGDAGVSLTEVVVVPGAVVVVVDLRESAVNIPIPAATIPAAIVSGWR